jgi:hypothetical protein
MRTRPGQTGIDAEYVGPADRNPGFKYAELKPYTESGYNEFLRQLENWNLAPGQTSFWAYNPAGIIGFTGTIF